ncbi:MAG: Fe-S cluster assembly sulfur transfer protein SufU [Woeseiaceae bacterium]
MTVNAIEIEDIQDLYRELILDHARSPRHFGRLDGATHTARGINPLCGDKLALYLRVSDDGIIEATAFEGTGCAISIASASLLSDTVVGLTVKKADAMFRSITGRLANRDTSGSTGCDITFEPAIQERVDKLHALDGVREFPSRVKCATLAWHALHSALDNEATPATTE